jgi:hypothetical protein
VSIKDKIRQAQNLHTEIVNIPEWDVKVEVRSMSARQRAALQTLLNNETVEVGAKQEQMWAFLLGSCCFDPETGDNVFSDEDMDWLFDHSAFAPIDRLATACLNVSAVMKGASDELGKSSLDTPTEMA